MESCHQMVPQQHKDKVEFLKNNGMCYACLLKGHMSSACKRRLTCQICQKKHPTILHMQLPVKTPSIHQATNPSGPVTQSSACTVNSSNHQTMAKEHTGTGVSDCKLATVPVKVKSIKSNQQSVCVVQFTKKSRSFVRSVVFPVAVNHSVSRSDSLPPSAPHSHSRIANASRVVQTHFLPPPLVLIRESRMPAESFRLTSSLRPSFSFANRECQPSRSDSLPPSFTTFKRITNAQCSSHS